MTINVTVSYMMTGNATLDLPDDRTWADVQTWFIKWDTLHITWTDGTLWSGDLNTNFSEGVDCKRVGALMSRAVYRPVLSRLAAWDAATADEGAPAVPLHARLAPRAGAAGPGCW
jgi:hypothetical protein